LTRRPRPSCLCFAVAWMFPRLIRSWLGWPPAHEALRSDVDRTALHARAIEFLGKDLAEPITAEFFTPERPVPAALRRKIHRTLAPWRRYNAAEALFRGNGRAAALAWDTINRRFLTRQGPCAAVLSLAAW
jgi:hypothetical protein